MNTGALAASVNVNILTDTGQQNGLANAITVAPDQVIEENISPYVRGAQAVAMEVDRDGSGRRLGLGRATAGAAPGRRIGRAVDHAGDPRSDGGEQRCAAVRDRSRAGRCAGEGGRVHSGRRIPAVATVPVQASAGATTPVTSVPSGRRPPGLS